MVFQRTFAISGFVVLGLWVAGCSDSHGGRKGISGTVRLKGQPIPDGAIIEFSPLESQTTGVNAEIRRGNFDVPRESGLLPGQYLVRVTAGDGKTPAEAVDPDSPPGPVAGTNIVSKDLVPADWNQHSKQKVTVTKEGPNRFDFDIP
jgi:hypothetical protein